MIAQCIRHEMSPMMSTTMEAAVTSVKAEKVTDQMVECVISEMQKRISLSNTDIAYIRGAIKRAREYTDNGKSNGIEYTMYFPTYNVLFCV